MFQEAVDETFQLTQRRFFSYIHMFNPPGHLLGDSVTRHRNPIGSSAPFKSPSKFSIRQIHITSGQVHVVSSPFFLYLTSAKPDKGRKKKTEN